jgi:N6-L-threonylcarbamoyladenine synthase
VIQYLAKEKSPASIPDIAASFQKAVVDVLVGHTMTAAQLHGFNKVALAGGVASNNGLREAMIEACKERGLSLNMPEGIYCTDNAAMAASRGYFAVKVGKVDGFGLNAYSRL